MTNINSTAVAKYAQRLLYANRELTVEERGVVSDMVDVLLASIHDLTAERNGYLKKIKAYDAELV